MKTDYLTTGEVKSEEELMQMFLEAFYKNNPGHSFQDQQGVLAVPTDGGFIVYILHKDRTWSNFEVQNLGKMEKQ